MHDVFVFTSCLGLVATEVECSVFKCGNDQQEVVDKLSSSGGVVDVLSASAWEKF